MLADPVGMYSKLLPSKDQQHLEVKDQFWCKDEPFNRRIKVGILKHCQHFPKQTAFNAGLQDLAVQIECDYDTPLGLNIIYTFIYIYIYMHIGLSRFASRCCEMPPDASQMPCRCFHMPPRWPALCSPTHWAHFIKSLELGARGQN